MRKRSALNQLIGIAVPVLVVTLSLTTSGTASASTSLRDKNTLARTTAKSDPALTFGQWRDFSFGKTGTWNSDGAFTFHSADPVVLKVTDGLCRGDRFRVYDRGSAIFVTSKVATDPSCDDTPFIFWPSGAWQDQTYSKGRFVLEPGWHKIRIKAVNSPFDGGSGWLKAIRQPVG